MKILHILNELKPSGAEMMINSASEIWIQNGKEVYVLSTGEKCGEFKEKFEASGIKVLHLPFKKSLSFFYELFNLLRINGFDIVHIHCERASQYYAIISKIAGIKNIIRTVHSNFEFYGLLRYKRIITRKISCLLGVKTISISKSVYNTEKNILKNKTILINNWINDEKFSVVNKELREVSRKKLNIKHNEFVIISIGNCSKVKNHKFIIETLANLPSDFKYRYIHIGVEDCENSERELVKKFNIEDNVQFLGYVEDIREYLYCADCYMMVSKYEGVGLAALEAMVVGIPIILTDVIGLRDFKEFDSELINYVKLDESKDCAKLLISISKLDLDKKLNLANEISIKIRNKHGKKMCVGEYDKLYCNIN